jgi:hypothetical protein
VLRKFTLVDAMVLIAATAVAFVPITLFYNSPDPPEGHQNTWVSWMSFFTWGWELNLYSSAIVVAWSAALCLLCIRKPRPRLSRVWRQPGVAACLAILIASAHFLIQNSLLACFYHFRVGYAWSEAMTKMGLEATCSAFANSIDMSVPIVWLVQMLSRTWRAESSWIGRTGRVLGVYCTVSGILYGWVDLDSFRG